MKTLIHLVTFNHAATVENAILAALEQEDAAVWVTDNGSIDGTREILARFTDRIRLFLNGDNLGFSRAHNQAVIRALDEGFSFICVLNPDLKLAPDAAKLLRETLEYDTLAGMSCPRLIRCSNDFAPLSEIDAAGMYFTKQLRHFDRGGQSLDAYLKEEYVFGGSGAALMFSATCAKDILETGEFFDEDFFAYREDADLAWRAQKLGWRCRYVPKAVGWHVRRVVPENRAELPANLNSWSVRNRFLMQWKNFSPLAHLHCILPTMWRNLLVVGAACTVERTSLDGVKEATVLLPTMLRKRRSIERKRREGEVSLASWFEEKRAEPAIDRAPSLPIRTIAAIIISYRSGDRLRSCIESLQRATLGGRSLRIIVVENTPSSEKLAGVEYLDFGKNLGFSGAIQAARSHLEADVPEALLILNPDVVLETDTLQKLANALEGSTQLGAIAPLLMNEDGTPQLGFTCRRFPTLGSTAAELLFLHRLFPQNRWTVSARYVDSEPLCRYITNQDPLSSSPFLSSEKVFPVEQPAGACVLIKTPVFDSLKGFDEAFYPAWFEDVDFFKRLAKSGWAAGLLGSARAKHEGGYSLHEEGRETFLRAWYRNLRIYFRKHAPLSNRLMLELLLIPALLLRAGLAVAGGRRKEAKVFVEHLWRRQ